MVDSVTPTVSNFAAIQAFWLAVCLVNVYHFHIISGLESFTDSGPTAELLLKVQLPKSQEIRTTTQSCFFFFFFNLFHFVQ